VLVIVETGQAALANRLLRRLDPSGGDALTIELSSNGSTPPTHGACSWVMTEKQAEALEELLFLLRRQGRAQVFRSELLTFQDVLAGLGLRTIAGGPH
jgi:hypothetical protein